MYIIFNEDENGYSSILGASYSYDAIKELIERDISSESISVIDTRNLDHDKYLGNDVEKALVWSKYRYRDLNKKCYVTITEEYED